MTRRLKVARYKNTQKNKIRNEKVVLQASVIIGIILCIYTVYRIITMPIYGSEYTRYATYQGNNIYVTDDGNEWEYESDITYIKGSRCLLYFITNGTSEIYDDKIIEVY